MVQGLAKVYIKSAIRTPIGSFLGNFRSLTAMELGIAASKKALETSGVASNKIQEFIFGNVLSADLGQAPSRQVALGINLLDSVCCTTINKVCSSGLKAVTLAAQSIQLREREYVMCGGMESMSNVPHYLPREPGSYGDKVLRDGVVKDGLFDVYNKIHMGVCAEQTAAEHKINRTQQDAYCISSYKRAITATEEGKFDKEIVEIEINTRQGVLKFNKDEEPDRFNQNKIDKLKPAFAKSGTVTAANSSKLSDGAAALVLSSNPETYDNNFVVEILAWGDAETSPKLFTIAPSLAIPLVLKKAGLQVSDVDKWELNEAFSVVALVNQSLLKLDPLKVNCNGGAVALGHPLGASGARILVTLVHQLEKGQIGCAAICNGGGGATAILVQRIS